MTPCKAFEEKYALPKLYGTMREHISCRLKVVQADSFTSDIWTSDVCPMSLPSIHYPFILRLCKLLLF